MAIMQEKFTGMITGQSFPQLLQRPFGCGVFGEIEM
jgi:hypothetical protein